MVKAAVKGQKEIADGNAQTLLWYSTAVTVTAGLYAALALLLWDVGSSGWTGWGLSVAGAGGAILLMRAASGVKRDEKGRVVDGGLDLDDTSTIGEPCKDIVILASLTLVLALISNYAFLLLLAVPGYAGYKFCVKFLIPWATSGGEEEDAANQGGDDKKARKMERKQRRFGQ